jgi:hypothetical protein
MLTFPHSNVDDLELDIDVHPRLAAAQNPEDEVAIRVSNLWTGKTIKEFKRGKESERVRNLKFMDDDGGGVEVWANWDGGVARFGW